MKITITIKNCITDNAFNIQVDNRQKIETTIRVLKENLPDLMQGVHIPRVKSQRSKRTLVLCENYEHEMIFSGDILMISDNKVFEKE